MENTLYTKTNGAIDIAKIIMAISIVMIHTNFLNYALYPFLRLSVPVFFIISSYLFFSKNKDKQSIKCFCKRNITLYLFWFLAILPFTVIYRHYLKYDFVDFIITFFKGVVLGSTFPASWFISALILSTIIIFYMIKYINTYIIATISISSFLFCLLCSNYSFINELFIDKVKKIFDPTFTFFVSLIYIYWIYFIKN